MLFIGIIALIAVNFVNLHALSAATSGGFLVVYAAVNLANVKLGSETNSWRWLSLLAALTRIIALGITLYSFAADPQTRISAVAVVAIVVLSGCRKKHFARSGRIGRHLSLQPRSRIAGWKD
jgi:amino acid transporter